MRLRLLQMFCEVVRCGGFSSAARATHASQSAVSKAVRQLEEDVGTPLLERRSSPPQLTPAGEIVYRHAQIILEEQQRIHNDLDELRGLRRGELRLGLPPLGSASLFAPLLAVYRKQHPLVEIKLIEHGSRRLETLLLAGELELAATLGPFSDDLDVQPVCKEPLMAVLPTDPPLASTPRLSLIDLADTPFIFFEAGFALNDQLRQACLHQGFEPTEGVRSGQIDFILALVAAGQGVAFLPRLMVYQQKLRQVRFVPLTSDKGTDWELALAWRRGAHLSAAAQAWLTLARERIPHEA